MKFNATYLARSDEELKALEKSLRVLESHTIVAGEGDHFSLDIFCTFRGGFKVVVAPIRGELPRLVHSSRSYEGDCQMTLSTSAGKVPGYYNLSLVPSDERPDPMSLDHIEAHKFMEGYYYFNIYYDSLPGIALAGLLTQVERESQGGKDGGNEK